MSWPEKIYTAVCASGKDTTRTLRATFPEASQGSIGSALNELVYSGLLRSEPQAGSKHVRVYTPADPTKPFPKRLERKPRPPKQTQTRRVAASPPSPPTPSHRIELPVETPAAAVQLRTSLDALATQLAQAVAAHILDTLTVELAKLVPAPSGAKVDLSQRMLPAAAIPTQPKVCIVGLLPQQAGLIQQEFGDVFDFKFWKNGTAAQLRDMVRSSAYVIQMTQFISHAHTELIRAAGTNPISCNGGMSSLKDVLTAIYTGEM